MAEYKTLLFEVKDQIADIRFNRPQQANAMNLDLWYEIKRAFEQVERSPEIRVAILSGEGRHFCSGIDLTLLQELLDEDISCEARKREKLRLTILEMQDCLSAIERCRKPVLAAVHGGCIGGGVDVIAACDMRYCTSKAYFTIKEIDIGMTADVGTLQRLPHIIGDGILRELAYTGRKVSGKEAAEINLVNRYFDDQESLMTGVFSIAKTIAAKAPLAVRGTKEMILYSRDHSVADSLNYIATWNASMLLSSDLAENMTAMSEKRKPKFQD